MEHELVDLDLGSFRGRWRQFVQRHENGCFDSFDDFLVELAARGSQLETVRRINLAGNQLSSLPYFVTSVPRLNELDLARNELTDLPSELARLHRLRVLRLELNDFEKLPIVVGKLKSLEELDVSDNQNITELPDFLADLSRLRHLGIVDTGITKIPASIISMPNLYTLDWRKLPLEEIAGRATKTIPPSTLDQGLPALRSYLRGIAKSPCPASEVKLILVGDGGAGKTTLLRNLLWPGIYTSSPRDSTKGVDVRLGLVLSEIDDLASRPVRVNLWDFGGQGRYRIVQQLFCTTGAVYAYVRSASDTHNEETYGGDDYWMQMIAAYTPAGTRYPGPEAVHYVVSKIDEAGPGFEIDEAAAKRDYPAISSFHRTSFLTNDGVEGVRRALFETLASAQIVQVDIPQEWDDVRNDLTKLKDGRKRYVSRSDFDKICTERGVDTTAYRDALLEYLNNSGAILHYGELRHVRNRIFIDPDWIRCAAFGALDHVPLDGRPGRLGEADWKILCEREGYDPSDQDILIEAMESLELCYLVENQDGSAHVFPSLFECFEATEGDPNSRPLEFRWRFDPFLPAGIVARFLVSNRLLGVSVVKAWRDATQLDFGNCRIELVEDWETATVHARAFGEEAPLKYLVMIRERLQALVRKYRKAGMRVLSVIDEIPCPCERCATNSDIDRHWFKWTEIRETARGDHLRCPHADSSVSRIDIVGGHDVPAVADNREMPIVFISFSSVDESLARRYDDELTRQGARVEKYDRNPIGATILDFIKRIPHSDGVLFLLSEDAMSSRWVHLELQEALEAGRRIFPVVVDAGALEPDLQRKAAWRIISAIDELQERRASLVTIGQDVIAVETELRLWRRASYDFH